MKEQILENINAEFEFKFEENTESQVLDVLRRWDEFIKNDNKKSLTDNKKYLDIAYYKVDKWWKRIIPRFLYSKIFKPNVIFKNCYIKGIE